MTDDNYRTIIEFQQEQYENMLMGKIPTVAEKEKAEKSRKVNERQIDFLKPCPFCGMEPTTIRNCNNVIIGVRCWNCSLDMVDEDYVKKWNRRVDQ